ncbi:hypothetical protein F5146DRAFT_1003919 [Armillaria mellea]|nr:hypothetical protein F5146DRAFT_1003919 [Armillaria mellea]
MPAPGPSKKQRSQSRPSTAPKPHTGSAPILVGVTPPPPLPPIDPVLLAPQPHPAPPSCLLMNLVLKLTMMVGALGIHPQAPIITWDHISKSESSPTPARVALPLVIHDERNIFQDELMTMSSKPMQSADAKLNDIIMDHLVHHRGIKLEGFHMPEVVERLTSEYMAMQWNIQPGRVVEVHATYMDEHHDADGKMTLIIREQALQFCIPSEEDEGLCVSFTLVLLPGDLYFQPPGAIHAVYTPEPSFIQYDRASGMWLTNLDHPPERVYEGLVRMMLALPTNPKKCKPHLHTALDPPDEISKPAAYMLSHPRAYGLMILRDKATPEQQKWLNEEQVQALGRVKKTPWADQVVKYAKQVSKAMGWSTKKELQLFLQTGAGLSDPGEKISIAPVLREILVEQREAREAQD